MAAGIGAPLRGRTQLLSDGGGQPGWRRTAEREGLGSGSRATEAAGQRGMDGCPGVEDLAGEIGGQMSGHWGLCER